MEMIFFLLLTVLLRPTLCSASQPTPTAIVGRWQPADKQGVLEIYE